LAIRKIAMLPQVPSNDAHMGHMGLPKKLGCGTIGQDNQELSL